MKKISLLRCELLILRKLTSIYDNYWERRRILLELGHSFSSFADLVAVDHSAEHCVLSV